MRHALLCLALLSLGCRDATAPNSVAGTYPLVSVGGESVPTATVQAGRMVLRADQTFLDILSYSWLGFPRTDTLRGDWVQRGDSLTFWYAGFGAASNAGYDGQTITQQYGPERWVYRR